MDTPSFNFKARWTRAASLMEAQGIDALFLMKPANLAYLTGDGRWITYRQRTGVDTDAFRLGQSFWPEDHLKPVPPDDLVGKWSIFRLPKLMWQGRQSGLPFEDSLLFGSFRSAGSMRARGPHPNQRTANVTLSASSTVFAMA